MFKIFSKIKDWIKDLCFPPSCYICNAFTDTNGLCAHCWKNIKWISEPKCKICGLPFTIPMQSICAECMKKRPYFDAATSVFIYDDFSKKMILQFKNGDCTYMAPQFVRWMYRIGEKDLSDVDMLIPVPISMLKRLRRQYNQTELLAMELSKISGITYEPRILRKVKSTRPQEGLSRTSRQKNLAGSFGVSEKHKHLLKDKNIVIIDDVMTTGTTVNECAKILKKHGCRRVSVLTIARVTLNPTKEKKHRVNSDEFMSFL